MNVCYSIDLAGALLSGNNGKSTLLLLAGQLNSDALINEASTSNIAFTSNRLSKNELAVGAQLYFSPYPQFSFSAETGQIVDNLLNYYYGLGASYNTESTIYGLHQSYAYFDKIGLVRSLSISASNRKSISFLKLNLKGGVLMQRYLADKTSPFKSQRIDYGFIDVSTQMDLNEKWQTKITTRFIKQGLGIQLSFHYTFKEDLN